jgi:hypothetical protein
MERLVKMLLLFLLSFAVSCGDGSTFDKEEIGTSASKITTLNDLAYPLLSMSSWTNANYGACGYPHYFAGKCHNGADIMADHGTPVYAITAGKIIVKSATQDPGNNCKSSGWGYDYGQSNTCNMGLLVRHYDASGEPFVAVYGHLRYDPSLAVGTTFAVGQQIGVIGRWYNTDGTWKSSQDGDHLHWGIHPGGSTPPSGYGMMPCSASQSASTTFPEGCSNNGFVPPGTFITEHFPQGPLFSHYDPPTVCESQPTGSASTNWYYTCPEKSVYLEGDEVWVLLRLYDVEVDHRYKVKAYKDGAFQWDWTTNLIDVGSGVWQYSHFWPELMYALPGEWRFDLFFIPEGCPEVYVDTASFTVYDEAHYHIATSPSEYYHYDGNGYTCPGPVDGGEDTNWVYTCGIPRTSFEQGETVYGLVRLDNITSNFRFSFDVYKDGAYQWNYVSGWSYVGEWGWSKTYFAPMMQNAQPGNWDFYVSVDDGNGFDSLDTLSFVVSPNYVPYEYTGDLVTCRGPVTGGAETNWEYTCQNPTSLFNSGDASIALIRIDNVSVNHRWKEEVYINGAYQWEWATDWFDVGQWGWSWTYFAPTTSSVWPGNWEYRIYLDDGTGFQYLDSAYFTVN